ncbi:TPA: hypothetical protein ACH3X3_004334 [Trebouxia sp. C0006]
MPVESAIWVTGASSLGLVGGTLVCTLLGAALFARGFAQDPNGMEQRTEQPVGKRRRLKPAQKLDSEGTQRRDPADS